MRELMSIAAAMAVAFGLVMVAQAGEGESVTVTGEIMCAKCTMQKEGAEKCQDVLVAEKDGKKMEFYLVKNDVSDGYGHTCQGSKKATVTGTLAEKDGVMWLTPSAMEDAQA